MPLVSAPPWPQNPVSYWWRYFWADGVCSPYGPLPKKSVVLTANRFNDGAFQGEPLISVNFFKEDRCSYWGAQLDDPILRWYARGYVPAPNAALGTFLSFRGATAWCCDRNAGSTQFKRGGHNRYSVTQRYTFRCPPPDNGNALKFLAIRYHGNANYPSEPLVPNMPLDRTISELFIYDVLGERDSGWNNVRNCAPTGSNCNAVRSVAVQWTVVWRAIPMERYTYQGKQVQYAGIVETEPGQPGQCEDWWFAEDIGPIFIISYPNATLQFALDHYLYGTAPDGLASGNYDPETHAQRHQTGRNQMQGYLALQERCTDSTCSVTY
jgi:hypothetical protein